MKRGLAVLYLCILISCISINLIPSINGDYCNSSNMKRIVVDSSNTSLEDILDGEIDLNCSIVEIQSWLNLTRNIIISSVSTMTITSERGEESEIGIYCDENSGMTFQNCHNISLQQLSFIGCGVEHNLTEDGFDNSDSAAIGVYFQSGSTITLRKCTFKESPGAAVVMNGVDDAVTVVYSTFSDNIPYQNSTIGGGLIFHSTNLSGMNGFSFLIEGCTFQNNQQSAASASFGGGFTALLGGDIPQARITITGTTFANNGAKRGGGFHVANFAGSLNLTISSCLLGSNEAEGYGGGAWISSGANSSSTAIWISGVCFNKNSARRGGGLAIQSVAELASPVILHVANSNWTVNLAIRSGSGIYLEAPNMNNNATNSTKYNLYGTFSNCHFIQNDFKAFRDVGAVFAQSARVDFSWCEFNDNKGTALYLQHSSYACLSGNMSFVSNVGITAAAIYMSSNSVMGLEAGVVAVFSFNHALLASSGTIFAEQSIPLTSRPNCVFENLESLSSSDKYRVAFVLNKVDENYRSIFITDATACFEDGRNLLFDNKVFSYLPNEPNQVASLGQNVSIEGTKSMVMPGETFQIVAKVYDAFGNPSSVSGYILLLVDQTHYYCLLCNSKSLYELVGPTYITMDSYTQNNSLFYVRGPPGDKLTTRLVTFLFDNNGDTVLDTPRSFTINISNCLPGFLYNTSEQICKCNSGNTASDNLLCHSHDYSCIRIGYWHGVNSHQNSSVTIPCPGFLCQYNNYLGCNNMDKCPFSPGYCRLHNLTEQCSSGREDILCSYCRKGYAFTFGAVQCVPISTCTGVHTSVLLLGIFLYWLLSIATIFMVLTLNLSIGSGFMYGIVYYFSVISLYTDNSINDTFLSTLVHICTAFTQMNPRVFGHVKLCFAESWNRNLHHHIFDYVTPIFIISFITLLMILSRLCSRWPKRISFAENSPIHAICILILFSSSSLAFTSFEILKPLSIYNDTRVFIEPNYTYFGEDHIPYAIFGVIVECFISLPICILLLFAPLISKRIDLVKWKLKSILDEFQACYRSGCRWFAGYYFLARQLVYLANAFNHTQSLPQDNIVLHYLNAVILLVHVSFQPYASKWLNALDAFLLADILMISFPQTVSTILNDHTLHQVSIYALILLPSLYLLGILFGLITRRFYTCVSVLCITRIPTRSLVNEDALERSSKPTYSTIAIHDQTESISSNESFEPVRSSTLEDSFYADDGEREPLLAKSHESYRDTVTSMRLSSMAKLPRFLTNSRRYTNSHSASIKNSYS